MLYKIENIFNASNTQKIIVNNFRRTSEATLAVYDNSKKIFATEAFIGKNGITQNKIEGDGKTPEGIYELGIIFGTHDKEELQLTNDIKYIKINRNLYWIDDSSSKYYNQLVDITKVRKDWESSEHLIKYPEQYEYAIEIKVNPKNISGKR